MPMPSSSHRGLIPSGHGPRAVANVAFWNMHIGGVGTTAGTYLLDRYHGDGQPFAMSMFHLDTDPSTSLATDDQVLVQLAAGDVRAMRANPRAFGPIATAIIHNLERLLAAGDILNGSRTTRALTQLAFIFHRERICRALHKSLNHLRERFKVSMVMPVFISSSGGGTGSAAQILLMDLFRQPDFRLRVLGGSPSDLLLPPMSFVVEPHAYANAASLMQGRKIMANGLAFRLESEAMLQQHAASYVCHIGYANSGGTVLNQPALMARVLGNGVYEIERSWPTLKGRWVDGPDDIASITSYGGQDVAAFLTDGQSILVRRKTP